MNGLEWLLLAIVGAALLGVAAAWIYLSAFPVDTGSHEIHRPLSAPRDQ
jgi:hypothetical protein